MGFEEIDFARQRHAHSPLYTLHDVAGLDPGRFGKSLAFPKAIDKDARHSLGHNAPTTEFRVHLVQITARPKALFETIRGT